MVDSVLLLVDAVEGPMPQTRFVTKKALALGLKPIVVVNKVDRPGARADYVINATFDLFDKLGATEEQLDFPVVFASGLNGWATLTKGEIGTDLAPLFDAMLEHVPAHAGERRRPAAAADLLARLLHLRRPHRHRPRQPGHAQADAERGRLQRPGQHAVQRPRQPGAEVRRPGAPAGDRGRPRRHRADQRHREHRHRRDPDRHRATRCRCRCSTSTSRR